MILVSDAGLSQYTPTDPLLEFIKQSEEPYDAAVQTHRWLYEFPQKRMTYWNFYGDLLKGSKRLKVLDIGGGYSSLTKLLSRQHDYFLIDILVHGGEEGIKKLDAERGQQVCFIGDLAEYPLNSEWDLVIAHDIFPNVDQRLELFFEKVVPKCKLARVSLTFYPTPRYYKVKRTDGEEVFFMKAWDHIQTSNVLAKYASKIINYDSECLYNIPPSIFSNGRQVALIEINGGVNK